MEEGEKKVKTKDNSKNTTQSFGPFLVSGVTPQPRRFVSVKLESSSFQFLCFVLLNQFLVLFVFLSISELILLFSAFSFFFLFHY